MAVPILPPLNFFQAPRPQTNPFEGLGDLVQNYQQGYQGAQNMQQNQLANQLQQQINPWKVEQAKQQAMNAPFAGLTGPAAEAHSANKLLSQLKPGTPEFERATQWLDLNRAHMAATTKNQNALAESLSLRYATPEARAAQEAMDVNQGYMPGTNQKEKLSPQDQVSLNSYYNGVLSKKISDPTERLRLDNGTNVQKTFKLIDPVIMAQYAGGLGAIQKIGQGALAAVGLNSENYAKYEETQTRLDNLKSEYRQFYAESITPEQDRKIEEITNPAIWSSNPELAIRKFKALEDQFNHHMDTYRDKMWKRYGSPQDVPKKSDWSGMSDEQLEAIYKGSQL